MSTDKDLTRALQALVGQPSQSGLPAAQPRGVQPMAAARGRPAAAAAKSGGGIAGPLTEPAYNTRTYWADETIQSSDGLLTFVVKPIKQVILTDATGADVVIVFANPHPQ